MKIFNYDSEYNTYTGASYADESPLEPGVYHIPAYATDVEPPECQENQIQIFDGEKWNIIEDNRGLYYNINTLDEYFNLNPYFQSESFTKIAPPEPKSGHTIKWNGGWGYQENIPDSFSIEEKLQKIGITIEELKELLNNN